MPNLLLVFSQLSLPLQTLITFLKPFTQPSSLIVGWLHLLGDQKIRSLGKNCPYFLPPTLPLIHSSIQSQRMSTATYALDLGPIFLSINDHFFLICNWATASHSHSRCHPHVMPCKRCHLGLAMDSADLKILLLSHPFLLPVLLTISLPFVPSFNYTHSLSSQPVSSKELLHLSPLPFPLHYTAIHLFLPHIFINYLSNARHHASCSDYNSK